MSCYEALAGSYDALTEDVGYGKRLDFIEKLLCRSRIPVKLVLDLACGTGSLSVLLAEHGYRVIGVDLSEEMLAVADEKCSHLAENRPFFVCQPMQRLRLPEQVDSVICALDSLNYVTRPADVQKTFRRVHDALTPGGLFLFDINTPYKLEGLAGQTFLDETEDTYCVWRTEYHRGLCTYYMDLFRRRGDGAWRRSAEVHRQRAYSVEELTAWLAAAGFGDVRVYGDMRMRRPRADEQRVYISCVRK